MQLNLEEQEIQIILQCMAKQPYEIVAPTILKIQKQLEKV